MGNYRFRFSDMMPSAWLSKLRGINRARKHHALNSPNKKHCPSSSTSHKTHYFAVEPMRANRYYNSPTHPKAMDTHFPSKTPKRSYSMKRTRRKTVYRPSPRVKLTSSSSVSAVYRCQGRVGSLTCRSTSSGLRQVPQISHPLSPTESSRESLSSGSDDGEFAVIPLASDGNTASWPPCFCDGKISSSGTDIVIDVNDEGPYPGKVMKASSYNSNSESENPGVSRKDADVASSVDQETNFKNRPEKELKSDSPGRKSAGNSPGIRLRVNFPKIKSRKTKASARRGVSSSNSKTGIGGTRSKGITDSFAIIVTSVDPEKDFRESMLEMIVENNIWRSKDLEDLLACYLSLNSDEYHGIIIRAFEQIWLKVRSLRL